MTAPTFLPEHLHRTPQGHGLGARASTPDPRDARFALAPLPPPKMPLVFSLRDKVPEIYDQGQLGSCVENATALQLRLDLICQGKPDFRPARLWLYYEVRRIEHTLSTDAGSVPRDADKVLLHEGVPPEADFPYDVATFAVPPSRASYADAAAHKIAAYHAVPRNVAAMKAALFGGRAFTIGVNVFSSFEGDVATKTGMIPMPDPAKESLLGGHDLCVVGWRDDIGCVEVLNSWGPNWGDNGFCWIPYAYLLDRDLAWDFWYAEAEATHAKEVRPSIHIRRPTPR